MNIFTHSKDRKMNIIPSIIIPILLFFQFSLLAQTNCGSAGLSSLGQSVHGAINTSSAVAKSTVDQPLMITCNNRFDDVLIDGPAVFGEISNMIANAQHEVFLAFFVWDQDPCDGSELIMNGLQQNALNRLGSSEPLNVNFILDHQTGFGGTNPLPFLFEELDAAGLSDHPMFEFRFGLFEHTALGNFHDKYCIVDRNDVMIMGTNVEHVHNASFSSSDECTQEQLPGFYHSGQWKDAGYTFTGDLAASFVNSFTNTWNKEEIHEYECIPGTSSCAEIDKEDLAALDFTPEHVHTTFGSQPVMFATKTRRTALFSNDIESPQDQAWIAMMSNAQSHINIVTPNINDDEFRRQLVAAVGRGVTVNLVTGRLFNADKINAPGQGGYNLEVISDLREKIRNSFPNNVSLFKVKWYSTDTRLQVLKNTARATHAKFMSVDGTIGMIGSGNQDTQSWNFSQEMNIVLDGGAATSRLDGEFFEPVWATSNGAYVEMWNKQEGRDEIKCLESTIYDHFYNYVELNDCEGKYCDNDEVQSLIIYNTPPCRRITLYDDSQPAAIPNDDFVVIETQSFIERLIVNELEQNLANGSITMVYEYGGNLNGKVSSCRIGPACEISDTECQGFEGGLQNFWQAFSDDFDWSLGSGPTPTSGTGPSFASEGNKYIFLEASAPNQNSEAILFSPVYDLDGYDCPHLIMDYHMYGTDIGELEITLIEAATGNRTSIFSTSGNLGNQWNSASLNLSNFIGLDVYFEIRGTTTNKNRGDIAIDIFCIQEGSGATGAFVTTETYCDMFTFTPTDVANVSYEWEITKFPGVPVHSQSFPMGSDATLTDFVFTENGFYLVELTTTDECGDSFKTVEMIQVDCSCTVDPSTIDVYYTENDAYIYPYVSSTGQIGFGTFVIQIQKPNGRIKTIGPKTGSYQYLRNLKPCTEYTFRVKKMCPDGTLSAWSEWINFKTDCCSIAEAKVIYNVGLDHAVVYPDGSSWIFSNFEIKWGPLDNSWERSDTRYSSLYEITDLEPCTEYYFQLRKLCIDGRWSKWSDEIIFETECDPEPDFCGCDFIFLVDKSGSVKDDEYDQMECSIISTMEEIEDICGECDSRYAITSFSGTNQTNLDHAFDCKPHSDIGEDIGGNTNVAGGLANVNDLIETGEIGEAGEGNCLHVLIYTDATCRNFEETIEYNGSTYTVSEIADLLEQNYGATISIIHYGNHDANGNINNGIEDCEEVAGSVSSDGVYVQSTFDCESYADILEGLTLHNELPVISRSQVIHYDDNTEELNIAKRSIFEVNFFPNPISDWVDISHNFVEDYAIEILNIQGMIIATKNFTKDKNHIKYDLSDFSAGVYLVNFRSRSTNEILHATKIIKN